MSISFVLSLTGVRSSARRSQQVDEGEDEDPDQVDEVPVEADVLDEVGVVAGQRPPRDLRERNPEQDHPSEDVAAVEAGDAVEGRGEVAGPERDPVLDQVGVLVALAAEN